VANHKCVFTTSTKTNGNLGGLTGGDAFCQARAQAAGLAGTYMAWLSDSTGSPSTRFTRATVPYLRLDGGKIADSWAGLVANQSVLVSMNKTELNTTVSSAPIACNLPASWTSTRPDGTLFIATQTCSDWGSGSQNAVGSFGETDATNGFWTTACSGGGCNE